LTTATPSTSQRKVVLIGVLPGEGIGPAVTQSALEVLEAVAAEAGLLVETRSGGPIGRDAERSRGTVLPEDVVGFCREVFADGGAILNGPGGGRYVYELRRRFDLFFKISPLMAANGIADASMLKGRAVEAVDILLVRENSGGIYQGAWSDRRDPRGDRVAEHRFEYSEAQVRRFIMAAARLAEQRRGRLTVVWKESGLPSVSALWRDCAEEAAAACNVHCSMVDVDLMAYRLIQEAAALDVVAAPNLFGDVLADLGAVLLGSRGVSFSGNYTEEGEAVYQTNHGAAYELAGTDRANPVGQIFSVAMMMRETIACEREASLIEEAVRQVWREGWRTEDLALAGARPIGTREITRRIAERAASMARDLRREDARASE
jgi:3-isopropylmalate dehydrogenase